MSFLRRKGVAGFGLFALAMLLLLVLSSPLAADEGRELPTTLHDFDERFFRAADQLEYAIEGGAEIEFYEKLVELEALLQQARLNSASSLSAALIEKALSLQAGDLRDKYLLAAERLSPKHPFIRYQLTKAREGEARWGEVFLLLHTLSSAPVLHLSLFSLKAPFLLVGGTLTLLLGGLVRLLRSFAVSGRGRAPFSIIGGALSLGLAITLGPLALLFWLAVVLRRRARGYLFASGVLFLLWGLFSPGYSSLSSWVHHGTDPSRLSVLPSSFVLFFERDLPKSGFQSVTERAALTDGDPLLTALQIRFFVEQHDYDSAFT
ncbi:hypothetical protein MRY87_03130, partial [bacterium]|nr:hypothetical protein [bacterium]